MRQLYPDLWQTTVEHPLPGADCHAYLLIRDSGNVLFFGVGREAIGEPDVTDDLDEIDRLGGVAHVLLAHWHEAAPALRTVVQRFDARVTCHARDAAMVSRVGEIGIDSSGLRLGPPEVFWDATTLLGDIEAVPTPGHTVGSACYLHRSPHGRTYLFTGDTIWPQDDGGWGSITLEDDGDQTSHRASLDLLAGLRPDTVMAAIGAVVAEIDPDDWPAATAQVKEKLG